MRREFEHRFPKIIATTPEEKKEVKKELKERYLKFRKEIAPYEVSKTEKDSFVSKITDIEPAVLKKIEKYKSKPEKPFPIERIHLLSPGSVKAYTRSECQNACCNVAHPSIILDKTTSDVKTILSFVHERFHIGIPTALKKSEEEIPLWHGIEVYDEKRGIFYFGRIGEAVIAELASQVYQEEIKKNPLYKKEVKANEKILPWVEKLAKWKGWDKEKERIYLSGFYAIPEMVELLRKLEKGEMASRSKENKLSYLERGIDYFRDQERLGGLGRIKERTELAKLLGEIFEKSKEPEVQFKFKDRQEIFDQFAHAVFTANPLRMRKIIEGVLGKDAFKSFVEEQKEKL